MNFNSRRTPGSVQAPFTQGKLLHWPKRLELTLAGLFTKEAVERSSTKQQLYSVSDYECDKDVNEVQNASFYGTAVESLQYKPEYTEEELVVRRQSQS